MFHVKQLGGVCVTEKEYVAEFCRKVEKLEEEYNMTLSTIGGGDISVVTFHDNGKIKEEYYFISREELGGEVGK